MQIEKAWLDAEDVAGYLRVPVATVRALVHGGQLECQHFPIRVRLRDLERFVEKSRIKPSDLAHLDPYADYVPYRQPRKTKRGEVDRRYGPRY